MIRLYKKSCTFITNLLAESNLFKRVLRKPTSTKRSKIVYYFFVSVIPKAMIINRIP